MIAALARTFALAVILACGAFAQTFTDFRFTAEDIGWEDDFVGVIDNDNRTVTFTTQRWIENIAKLPAAFTVDDESYLVSVNGNEQISGITINDFRKDVVYKIGDDAENIYTVTFVSPQATGLPVIRIDTKDGVGITSKTTYVNMDFRLSDPNNRFYDVEKIGMVDSIRGRGNSTWAYAKKPFRIKFDKNTTLFGLPAAKSWVLLAEHEDVTLIKNSFAFEMGERLGMPYNHTYRHVELYLNNKYNGIYTLTEHNQVREGRVDIDENEGWFVERDWRLDGQPNFRTTNYSLPLVIKSPEPDGPIDMTNEAYHFVRNDWNELCDSMVSVNFPDNGYRDLIDIETFIQYSLLLLITSNGDSPGLSSFYYKDKGGKISTGPPWDFDRSFYYDWNYSPKIFRYDYKGQYYISQYLGDAFFNRLLQDPIFHVKWKETWNNNLSTISAMSQFIDSLAAKIEKSALENYKIWWPGLVTSSADYNYWIGEMKGILADRISFLDSYYNSVEALPATKTYTTATYNYVAIPAQKITLVAYDEMTDLSAILKNDTSSSSSPSPFEITAVLTQTPSPTGSGGYLATISIKPKDNLPAGTYRDTLILSGINQGNDFEHKVPLAFTVSPMSIASAEVTLSQTEYVYDGTVKTPLVTGVVLDGESLVAGTDYTIVIADNKNAGQAIVKVNGIGNYGGEVNKTFTIDKAPLEIVGVAVADKVYDGTATASVTGVTFGGLADSETLVLGTDFVITSAEYNSANAVSADTVTIGIALLGTVAANNYSLSIGTFTSSGRTISKATISGVPQTLVVKHNLARGYEFDLTSLLPDISPLTFGAVSYDPVITADADGMLGTLAYTSGNTLTIPVNAAGANSAAAITVTVSSGNYEDFTAVITIETTDKTPIVISAVMSGGEYSGTPYAYSGAAIVDGNGDPVLGVTLNALYESTDGGGYGSASAPADAGAYRLTLSVPASDAEYSGSAAFDFVITPKPVTIAADNLTALMGEVMPALTYEITGFLDGDGFTVAPTVSCAADMATAGVHEIVVSGGTASANYAIVRQNGTLTVIATYPVTVSSIGAGALGGGRRYIEGETVSISAGTPPMNHNFIGWTTTSPNVNFVDASDTATTFAMPANAVAVTAVWEEYFVAVADIADVPRTVTVGMPLILTGTVEPSNATNRNITWSVAPGGIGAEISGDTLVAAMPGEIMVIATIANGAVAGAEYIDYTRTFTINVEPPFVSIRAVTIERSVTTVAVPLVLKGRVIPSDATHQEIVWSVANAGSTGAVISGDTLYTAAAGIATVRATVNNGEFGYFSLNFNITVEPTVSVLSQDNREIPNSVLVTEEASVVAPVNAIALGFTVGPNPVDRSAGVVQFFVGATAPGRPLPETMVSANITGTLTIYNVMGNIVRKIDINTGGVPGVTNVPTVPRAIAEWDLRDARGRPVAPGTYHLRGTIMANGKREKVSAIIGVR